MSNRAFPSTPSRAHEDAWRRDAGHDAMQETFLAFLRSRPIAAIPEGAIVHRTVEAELPLHRNGRIVSFVDAAEILTINLTTIVSLFELKPRIDTVFGIVRQAKMMLELAQAEIQADQHYCHVVVPAGDPLIAALRQHWERVWAWGATFEPAEESDD